MYRQDNTIAFQAFMYVINVTDALHGNYAASNYLEPKAAVKQNNTL